MWSKGLALGPEVVPQGSLLVGEYYEFMVTAERGALESAQVYSLLIREARKLPSPGAQFIHWIMGMTQVCNPKLPWK